ncbi:MAG: hypothetical protein ACYCY1_05645 [Sulfuriferula sp.]
MTGKKLLISAHKVILKKLDQTYPTPITLDDREIGFYGRYDLSKERDRRAMALNDAFTYLKSEGLITYSSDDDRTPRTDLKLTPKGVQRPLNPIDAYKEDGIKAAIGAVLNGLARIVQDKLKL